MSTFSFPKPKLKLKMTPKIILNLNQKPQPKPIDIIYSGIKYECKERHAELRNKIVLTTHSFSHNRKNLENTGYFVIISSQNMKKLYITDKPEITLKVSMKILIILKN